MSLLELRVRSQDVGKICPLPFQLLKTVCIPWLGATLLFSSVQFSSVAQSCPTLCDPIDCGTPGFPVHHQLPIQTHVHRVCDAIQPSHPVIPFSSCLQSFSQHQGLFQWVSFYIRWSIGVSASASVLPVNIQDWFPLENRHSYLFFGPHILSSLY